jgi:hypothetical protein
VTAPSRGGLRSVGWRAVAVAAGLYAVTTVAVTWPLYRHPATSVLDTPSLYGESAVLIQRDINLTIWTLAWDAHALATDPLHLFDANSYYPAPYSLACAEHKLGNVPLFAPVYLATGNPVAAHQAALLASFVLAGLAMAAFVLYWIDDRAAALAAGFFYAFAPFRLWQLGSLDYISIEYLPLVLLGIDATLDRRGGRAAAPLLAGALALSSLCSYYIAYAAFVLAGIYLVVGMALRGRTALGRAGVALAALAAAGAVVGALTVPYLVLQRSGVLPDYGEKGLGNIGFLGMLKFGVGGLLSYYVLPRRDGIPEFLTYTGLALAVASLALRRRAPRGALVATAVTGVVLGLGPYATVGWGRGQVPLPYALLMAVVPGFGAMRVPHRFGALTTVGVPALAGLALAELRARVPRRAGAALPWLAVGLFLFEAAPGGLRALSMPLGDRVPPVYRWLAAHGDGGAVLELPAHRTDLYRESTYLYYSTFHWLPIVNGYSAYPPQSYLDVMDAVQGLPGPDALGRVLARVRPRWIVLHRAAVVAPMRSAYETTLRQALPVAAELGDDLVFDVGGAPGSRASGGG